MKKTPVRLTVIGTAYNRNQDEEAMHMTTFGTICSDSRGWKLRYTEQGADSNEKHDITMTMGDGMVTVARKGAFASDLVFRQGHRFEGNYHTPYGDLSMGIYPTRVDYSVNPEGDGAVSLRYQLDIQGRYASVHNLDIAFETNKKARRT